MLGLTALYNHYPGSQRHDKSAEYQLGGAGQPRPVEIVRQEALPADPQADRDEWRSEQDLYAQREMAKWAMVAAIVAIGGVTVTGIGVFFVKRTLDETRKAVQQSVEGTMAAHRSAKVAEEAVKMASENARRELRAYVFPLSAIVTGVKEGVEPRIVISLGNMGKTPAYNVDVWANAKVRTDETDLDLTDDKRKRIPDLGPGHVMKHGVYMDTQFVQNAAVRLAAQTHSLYAYGKIVYFDAFKAEHTTNFRFKTWGGFGLRDDDLATCDDGNDSD